jgi:Zn-dependent protease
LTVARPPRYLWATNNGREPAISLDFLIWAPVLLFSMVAHEYAHAEAAYRQGDDTAYVLGRLTMNPLKHIDPFLTILLPAFLLWRSHGAYMFGGAKPVPVNPRKYRRYVRGDVIVSLAGITVNLGLFVASALLFALLGVLARALPALTDTCAILQTMARAGMWFNLVLAFFNLIPIPPLDGSHVLYHLLPPEAGLKYRQLQRFGFLPIMALSYFLPGAITLLLWPAVQLMQLGVAVVGGYRLPGVTL